METILVIVAILALLGGAVALLAREGLLPVTLPAFRPSGTNTALESSAENDAALPRLAESERGPRSITPAVAAVEVAAIAPATSSTGSTQAHPRIELAPLPGSAPSGSFDRLESRLDALQRAIDRQNEALAAETSRLREELVLRAEAEEVRREAALERMRADVLAIVSRAAAERQPAASARRMEVSAELYAHLARLEAALATVTNPILLPGEPYAPPVDLAAESLVWENWNDVGERVFALAEAYSAQRLHLSAQTRSDVGEFVTTLRTLLTRSIYPNLQADIDRQRRAALLAALVEIAGQLPQVRDVLETEYLEGRSR